MQNFLPKHLSSRVWTASMRSNNSAAIADWYTTFFFWVGVALLITFDIAAGADKGWAQCCAVAAFGLVIAAASTASGWVTGLLFGIPRTLARPLPNLPIGGLGPTRGASAGGPYFPAANVGTVGVPVSGGVVQSQTATPVPAPIVPSYVSAASKVNTNLEDMSDWMTKTIVGVGLTQLVRIPHFLWTVSITVNAYGPQWGNHGPAFVLFVMMYFGVSGFWLGYVGTRTNLTKLFDSIDGPSSNPQQTTKSKLPENLKLDLNARTLLDIADPALDQADQAFLRQSRKDLDSNEEVAAWGAAQARALNFGLAADALQYASDNEPLDIGLKYQLATVFIAAGKFEAANRVLLSAGESDLDMALALNLSAPGGYLRAIEVGEKLLVKSSGQGTARIHLWLARAYGQQHAYLERSKTATAKDLSMARDSAVGNAKQCLKVDSGLTNIVYALWKPGVELQNADLASIPADDPVLCSILP